MKKVLFTLAMMLTTLTASAMSYKQAREQALFLTDKMAYELDLTEEQYEAAYEVNLDYLMSISRASRRPSPLSRRSTRAIRARPSARRPRSTTI